MLIKLTKTARVAHQPGEIIEVSPEVGAFLISVGSAELAEAKQPEEKPETKKKAAAKK